jgi:hypothetical protein
MTVAQLIRRMRELYDGFNGRASDSELWKLQDAVGLLPDDVLAIYRDHDGAARRPGRGEAYLPARLMPIDEVVEHQPLLDAAMAQSVMIGRIAWLWTDDNSNYVGVYTSGPLEGWWVKLDHEEPMLAPAWRSVASFLERLLDSAPGTARGDDVAADIPTIPRDVPAREDDPDHVARDRAIARSLTELYEKCDAGDVEQEDLRRLYACCAMALTPARDVESLNGFLRDDDMWTPETAVRSLEFRNYRGPIGDLERLAREGHANGDSAALRLLVRMRTDESEALIERLKSELTGHKKQALDLWLNRRESLPPPRWY